MTLTIGTFLVNRYRIVRLLGQGGFGAVYRAWDQNVNTPCALKENFESSPEATRQFAREAQMLASLRHPNLPKVTDHFTIPGQGQYLVMEYIDGKDLQQILSENKGPAAESQALPWMLQILNALEYLHAQTPPIIHRDIKPANIRVTPQGQAILVDFGIAKLFDPIHKTTVGARAITPGFSPIEQYGQSSTDARTDIYALGATIYTLLSGNIPPESISRTLKDQLVDLQSLNPGVSSHVAFAVQKAMHLVPEERWQTAREMREYLKSTPSTATVEDRPKEISPVLISVAPVRAAEKPRFQGPQQVVPREVVPTEYIPRPARSTEAVNEKRKKSGLFPLLAGGCVLVILLTAVILIGTFLSQVINYTNEPTQTLFRSSLATQPGVVLNEPTENQPIQGLVGEPIRVGLLAPLTGPLSSFGVSVTEGVRLAVKEWNGSNGVLGRPIELFVADSRCEAGPAVLETNRLIEQEGVKFIIGDVCSQASIPVSEIVNERQVLQISPTSSNPLVTQDREGRTKKFTFRTCFIDSFQGGVMAKFAIEEGLRTAFVIHNPDDEYSRGLAEIFKVSFTDLGGDVVGTASFAGGQDDFSEILTQAANSRAQLLFTPAYYDVVNKIGRQLKDRRMDIVMMGGDGWESSELDLGAVEGGFFSTNFNPSDPNPTVRAWVDIYGVNYKTETGQPKIPDAIAALGNDAANLLFLVIEMVGEDDPILVAERMAGIEAEGVTGVLRYDEHHNPQKSAVIMGIQNGVLRYIRTIHP